MAIQSNLSQAPIGLNASTDTTLLASVASPSRQAVTAFSLFNTTANARAIDIYESPDTTSAAGKKIASYTLAGNSSQDVTECIGQGYSAGQNIIAKQTTGGASANDLNAKLTTTLYTAGS
jgi:hypothetical protein